jgi:hypothetical protein
MIRTYLLSYQEVQLLYVIIILLCIIMIIRSYLPFEGLGFTV